MSRPTKVRLGSTQNKSLCRKNKLFCESLQNGAKKCSCNLAHVLRHPTFIVDHGMNCLPIFEGNEREQVPKLKASMDEWNWVIQKRFYAMRLMKHRYKGQLEEFVNEWSHDENSVI